MMSPLCLTVSTLACLCWSAMPAHAEDLVSFLVRWAGDSPNRIVVDDNGAGVDLTLDGSKNVFRGSVAIGVNSNTNLFQYMRLVSTYSDTSEKAIPLRIGNKVKVVTLRVFKLPTTLTCDEATVEPVERFTNDPDEAVKRYVLARDLYELVGPNRCASYMKKRVAKAWFDRSYALTQIKDYYHLDEDAAAAYRLFDPDYVHNYEQEAKAYELKVANDFKNALAREGHLDAAASVSDSIVKVVTDNPKLAKALETKQGLSVRQLNADKQLFTTLRLGRVF